MSFFDNENKEFNTKNILPIIGATIGVVLTLGAAGVALSPLLSVKIAGYAAGFASALGLTTLGAGLVFGAIFAIVAAVSISQILANKAMAKAQASINAQAEDIKKVEDSIKVEARDAFGVVIRDADIPNQVTVAIATAKIPAQVDKAIKDKNLVGQGALDSAIKNCAPQVDFANLEGRVKANEDALGEKADTSALVGLVSQADFGELKAQVENHSTELSKKLNTDDLDTQVGTLLDNDQSKVTQHLGSKYAPIQPTVSGQGH